MATHRVFAARSTRSSLVHAALLGAAIVLLAGGLAMIGAARVEAGNAAHDAPTTERAPLAVVIGPAPENEMPWYSTQLHIHGWSNHNAGNQPGSMQYHTAWAQAVGLDVIWWSDHNKMFVQAMDLPLYLEGATITNTLDIALQNPPWIDPWFRGWQIGWLDATVTGSGTPVVALNNGVLRMELSRLG